MTQYNEFHREHFLNMAWPPSPSDIAHSLDRVNRWNNQTIASWTVLQHSLLVDEIAMRYTESLAPIVRLYSLWHDCEETCTGDIPTPWKANGQQALSLKIRKYIWLHTLGVNYPSDDVLKTVERFDRIAAVNEAHVFCHTRVRREIGDVQMLNDDIIDDILRIRDPMRTDNVFLFLARTGTLLTEIQGCCT